MAPYQKITEKFVERVRAPETERDEYWDPVWTGLGLRVSAGGYKSFQLMYHYRGRQRRLTLGRYHEKTFNVAAAKEKAKAALEELQAGRDPAERYAKSFGTSMDSVFLEYEQRHLEKLRTGKAARQLYDLHVSPHVGARAITSIRRADVAELIDKVADKGKLTQANRLRSLLLHFLGWAARRGYIDSNPAAVVDKPSRERSRDRVLSENEVRDVWAAGAELGHPFGDIVRLLLITGQRLSEVRGMAWSELALNPNKDEGDWVLPPDRTKGDREHIVPLTPLALTIIREVPMIEGRDLLFSTTGKTPVSGFSKAKKKLDEKIAELRAEREDVPMRPWRLHDIRRTVATNLEGLGVPPYVVGRVLNHAPARFAVGATATYARHRYRDEVEDALERWDERLCALVGNT